MTGQAAPGFRALPIFTCTERGLDLEILTGLVYDCSVVYNPVNYTYTFSSQ